MQPSSNKYVTYFMQRGMGELAVSGGGGWGGTCDLLEHVLYQKKW